MLETLKDVWYVLPLLIAIYFLFVHKGGILLGWRIIPNEKLGLVEKTWSQKGGLPQGQLIATNGEAGIQAELLTSGLKFFYWPWMYKVDIIEPFRVPQGCLGLVTSNFGLDLDAHIGMGKVVQCNDFQDIKAFFANGGQRGQQMHYLKTGTYGINPKMFTVQNIEFTVISEGQIGAVESQYGLSIEAGKILAKEVECNNFQNITAFHQNGGQKGPQRQYLSPGTYMIDTRMFKITRTPFVQIASDEFGVVTTFDGIPLESNEIAGPSIKGHQSYQSVGEFLDGGGKRGLQEDVLLSGEWRINPFFATVEKKKLVEVPIGNVLVLTKNTGEVGEDISGDEFKHGTIVENGKRGVQSEPLNPGRYPINPRTNQYEVVPTTNIVLNWAEGKTEAHKLDENLSTIKARTKDGFQMSVDVSQIINISYLQASKVIARFGTLRNLISQVLEPTIGNYFRNSIQAANAMDFINERENRQKEAKVMINKVLAEYNVVGVDTLIGDVVPPEQLLIPIREQHIAAQTKKMYENQMDAEKTRKDLETAKAEANKQSEVVNSIREVEIAEKRADAVVKKQEGDSKALKLRSEAEAEATKVLAEAEAEAKKKTGGAEAEVIEKIGEANAKAYEKQIASVGAANFTQIKVTESLAASGIEITPKIVTGGDGSGVGALVGLQVLSQLGALPKTSLDVEKKEVQKNKQEVTPVVEQPKQKSSEPSKK